jgi:hypothetical protein
MFRPIGEPTSSRTGLTGSQYFVMFANRTRSSENWSIYVNSTHLMPLQVARMDMILTSYNWLYNFYRIPHDVISEPLSSHRHYIYTLLYVVFLYYEYLLITLYARTQIPKLAGLYLAQGQADYRHCAVLKDCSSWSN